MTVRTRLRVKQAKQSEDGTCATSGSVVPKLEEPSMETGQTARHERRLHGCRRMSASNIQTWLYRVHWISSSCIIDEGATTCGTVRKDSSLLGGPVCSTTEMAIVYLLVAGILALTAVGAYKQLAGLGSAMHTYSTATS